MTVLSSSTPCQTRSLLPLPQPSWPPLPTIKNTLDIVLNSKYKTHPQVYMQTSWRSFDHTRMMTPFGPRRELGTMKGGYEHTLRSRHLSAVHLVSHA